MTSVVSHYSGPVITGKPGIRLVLSSSGFSQSPLPTLCRQATSCARRSRLRRIVSADSTGVVRVRTSLAFTIFCAMGKLWARECLTHSPSSTLMRPRPQSRRSVVLNLWARRFYEAWHTPSKIMRSLAHDEASVQKGVGGRGGSLEMV